MNKQTLVFQGPIATRSGYGDHSRDLLKALRKLDRYDIKIIPMRWGNTPQNQLDTFTEFGSWVLNNIITEIVDKPDIFIQVSVANEFQPKGVYNIGVTAGVETNIIPREFIDGSNKMDLIIVPSEFTKNIMEKTIYQQKDANGNLIGEYKIKTRIVVLFEGIDLEILLNSADIDILNDVDEDFCFLTVGHWLKGDIGCDRKDIGMVIKTFSTIFSNNLSQKPALILKTSTSGFSIMDREIIRKRIEDITKEFGEASPSIYLLHGDLTPTEMASLYRNSKIKAMVSFTKGEGYGRPLAEFASTGKPIIVPKWSGYLDFLSEENTIFIEGKLENIHPSAVDKFLIKESKWYNVNYSMAANAMNDVYRNYKKYKNLSTGLKPHITENFSLEKMTEIFDTILKKYVKKQPNMVPIKIPKLDKIK
jgi:glycosyltransferase involved in cell wall biosynthesis